MSTDTFSITLHVWKQKDKNSKGQFETHKVDNVSPHMSFLEMMDYLNEKLVAQGKEPVYFESDCREGICGTCGLVINGEAHGPGKAQATCQLHMRQYKEGDEIWVEPWRAASFPVIQDLAVDRTAFDRIQQAGGYVSMNVGSAPDGNAIPIPKEDADYAFSRATCIGCGACVAACKNASAMLFVSAKVAQFAVLPQGQAERKERAQNMVAQMDKEAFGSCTNEGECSAVCPKEIPFESIVRLNREFIRSNFSSGKLE